jgi:hypothetical protein
MPVAHLRPAEAGAEELFDLAELESPAATASREARSAIDDFLRLS